MQPIIRAFIFHILSILTFALIYSSIPEQFHVVRHDPKDFIDYLLLSTTIQAGIGISDLFPISNYSKIMVMLQQLLMLFTHVITFYIFTL